MLRDMVQETANAIGAALTINLLGPVSGRQGFLSAFGGGVTVFYVIEDGVRFELGQGVVTAGSPVTLTRSTVYRNSEGSTGRINFPGVVNVYNAVPADRAPYINPLNRETMLGGVSMGPFAGLRNLIINGNPTINQRGYVNGTATTGGLQYTLDRWRVVVSGQSVSWTDSAGIRTVTAPLNGMEQVIEGASNLGGVHSISWIGTATATVNGATVANGGQVTLVGGADVTVRMSGGTWSQLQLEAGSVPTSFERRPEAAERALAQRYFERATVAFIQSPAVGSITVPYSFKATKRRIPTMTTQSVVADFAVTASAFDAAGPDSVGLRITVSSAGGGRQEWTINADAEY